MITLENLFQLSVSFCYRWPDTLFQSKICPLNPLFVRTSTLVSLAHHLEMIAAYIHLSCYPGQAGFVR